MSRRKPVWTRRMSATMVACLLLELAAPAVLLAQGAGADQPREFRTAAERQAYIAEVQSDLSVAQAVQRQLQDAQGRDQQYQQHHDYWVRMRNFPPPAGQDPNAWRQHVESQVQKFSGYRAQNQELMRRAQQRLATQQRRIQQHDRTIRASRDEIVRQNLGTVIGVTGLATAPVIGPNGAVGIARPTPGAPPVTQTAPGVIPTGRPSFSEAGTMLRQGGRALGSRAAGATASGLRSGSARATDFAAASRTARQSLTPQGNAGVSGALGRSTTVGVPASAPQSYTRWTAVPAGAGSRNATAAGHYQLRQVTMVRQANGGYIQQGPALQTVRTEIPVNVQNQSGQWVRSADTRGAAQATAVRRQAMSQARQGVQSARLSAQEAGGTAAGRVMNRSADALEARQARMQEAYQQHNQQNGTQWRTRAAQLGASAARWAAFSAGVAVTSRAVESWRRDGSIDWGYATQDLRDWRFYTGTAGSFVGSMAASAAVSGLASAIPGGHWVRALAAVGGAAVGWQVGSGNLSNTDWTQLAVTTVGATVGSVIGASVGTMLGGIFGPVGMIAGGMIGHFLADWALRSVRSWLDTPTEAYSGRGDPYAGSGDPYAGGSFPGGASTRPDGKPYAGGKPGVGPPGTGPPGASSGGGDVQQMRVQRNQLYSQFLALQARGDMAGMRSLQQQMAELDRAIQGSRVAR